MSIAFVPAGQALPAALSVVQEIAGKPQAALRSDRLSSCEQWSLTPADALADGYGHGMSTLQTGQMLAGLDDYASRSWRGGSARARCGAPPAAVEGR